MSLKMRRKYERKIMYTKKYDRDDGSFTSAKCQGRTDLIQFKGAILIF